LDEREHVAREIDLGWRLAGEHAGRKRGDENGADQQPVHHGPPSFRESTEDATSHGALQAKFAASSMLPDRLYTATCGYGQSGRVRSTVPPTRRDATTRSGAFPSSTHSSSTRIASNVFGPSPPPQ